MSRFSEEIEAATTALGDLRRAIEQSTRGEKKREQDKEKSASLSSVLSQAGVTSALGLAASGLGQVAASAFQTFSATGSVDDAEGAGLRTALELATEGSNVGHSERRILEGARSQVLGVTQDYARYGIELNPDSRQRTIDTAIEQQMRIERERSRVTGEVYTLDRLKAVSAPDSPINKNSDILERIENLLRDNLPSGGRHR